MQLSIPVSAPLVSVQTPLPLGVYVLSISAAIQESPDVADTDPTADVAVTAGFSNSIGGTASSRLIVSGAPYNAYSVCIVPPTLALITDSTIQVGIYQASGVPYVGTFSATVYVCAERIG